MSASSDKNPDRTEHLSPDETPTFDQNAGQSMRTTLPEFPVGLAGLTTVPEHHDKTDVKLASERAVDSPVISHGSFAGELGRFNYIRTLGEGAFGIVVQVWDPELHAHRAIKVPHRELLDSRQVDAESYVREARKLAFLGKHPNIVEVLDIQRMSDGTPFVVSEYIPGGNLADKINKGRTPWREAVELIAQIADAITYAHSKSVVHRDLKPANILLTEEGKPVIVDFGLALGDDDFSYHSSVCGTYQYMSPQQVSGDADRVDGRSDIYSLGVILYQMVSGRLPYRSRDVRSLKREIVNDEPAPLRQFNPEAPAELEKICQRAMAKEPANRYSSAADFAQELRSLLKPATGTVRFGSIAGGAEEVLPAAPQVYVRRWWPVALSAIGCAIVGISLYSLFMSRRTPEPVPVAGPTVPAVSATPNLQILFQKNDSKTFSPNLTDANLPLEIGDKLQFQVDQLSKPMFAYFYWINAAGEPERLWPEKGAKLDQQTPVRKLSSPAQDDAWWAVHKAGGALVFFVGLSEKPLNEKQLHDFEAESGLMRESLLSALQRSRRPVAEFEFPAQSKTYEIRNNELYRTRGSDLHLVFSPKTYATDHSKLQNWFSAYHGWIVSTKE